MASIKEKLRGLSHISAAAPAAERRESDSSSRIISELDARIVENDYGAYVFREKRFSLNFVHGVPLHEFLELKGPDFVCAGKNQELEGMQPDKVLFIDTETTGLAGGTGTYAFLVGVGFFADSEFVVRQYFMRDYGEEPALLHALSRVLQDKTGLVSYNGKSYDIPVLNTRGIINKDRIPWDAFKHLDLLHASRRLWRKTITPCTLQNIEQNILGFRREGDIPGWEIPALYFDFLRNRDYEPIVPVFKHNVMDILSLVSITVNICRAFSGYENLQQNQYDYFSIIKTFEELGDHSKAVHACEVFLEYESLPELVQILLKNATLLKKMNRMEEAERVWFKVIDRVNRFFPEPYTELAKYYEHKLRDINRALEIVERAEKRMNIIAELRGGLNNDIKEQLIYRKQRLVRKLKQTGEGGET
ncbi:ribonuclease H-like domain-containing protein [candidate division KSB1 bacterium]|nr:ribonuclease H-like domain-containing protein [candidate division KSB1 bacterium]